MSIIDDNSELDRILETTNLDNYELTDIPNRRKKVSVKLNLT